jgi:hypothetical protein
MPILCGDGDNSARHCEYGDDGREYARHRGGDDGDDENGGYDVSLYKI